MKPAYVLLPKNLDSSMWITWTLFFIFYAYIIDVEIKLNIVINHKRRSQSITNARKIKQFCTYSNFIPTLASIFATHGRKFVKGKISFIKIKNGMKDEENAKTTFCGFIESMVCQNYAPVLSIFVNVKLCLSDTWQ